MKTIEKTTFIENFFDTENTIQTKRDRDISMMI